MKAGDLVKREYDTQGHGGGIVTQLREGAFENQPLAQVVWPHSGAEQWVEAKDMEVISESW